MTINHGTIQQMILHKADFRPHLVLMDSQNPEAKISKRCQTHLILGADYENPVQKSSIHAWATNGGYCKRGQSGKM